MQRSRLASLPLPVFLFLLGILIFSFISPIAHAQSRAVVIIQNVDESKLATLAGNTRPEATKQNDRGLVADSLPLDHMLLQLRRSPEQERELLQYIEELQTPSSPNFHHWLTAKQYGERFGLATQDIGVLTRWLESHGFKVNVVYENGTLIDFSGTAAQVKATFHTEIHELDVKGVKHFANMSDPRIPVALTPAVVGVVSMHDFKPHTNYKPRASYSIGSGYELVAPADLAVIYNLNPLFTASISGQGQTIVVIEDTDVYTTADWNTFRTAFGLATYTGGSFTQIHPAPPSGTNNCSDPGSNGNDGEAILDAEYASAAAPSAAIKLASCSDTATFGGLIAVQNLLNESATPPAIMSISYGECEAGNGSSSNAAYSSAYQQAVTEGVSVFVSSGDEGAASCNADDSIATFGIGVSAFASTPYNVAVGGTDFGDSYAGTASAYWSATNSPTYESALSYIPEIPWNDSCASLLGAEYSGYAQTYGSAGFCNSSEGEGNLTTASGSGGPSGCATGSPATQDFVGGSCAGWPKPSWQTLVGNPSDTVRDLPDVSLFAANGIWGHYYPYCWSDPAYSGNGGSAPCTGAPSGWSGAGGTSFSSPIMAGIQALINQNAGGPQGNPNPVYYQLAAAEYGASGDSSCNSTLGNTTSASCIFYDVTLGDMDVNCTGTHNCYLPSGTNGVLSTSNSAYLPAYGTTTGWDFATGIGSVNAANLVNHWPSVLSPTVTVVACSPNPANYGVSVTCTATVTTTGENLPTGNVTFYAGTTSLGAEALNGSQVATLVTSTLAPPTESITGVYAGDSNDATSTSVAYIETINPPTFSVSTPTTPAPAPAGEATTSTFVVTATGGATTFAAPVTFACNGLPDATVTCGFSSIAQGATSPQTVTLTINTTGPNVSGGPKNVRRKADNRSPWLPLTLPLAGIVMVGFAGRKISKYSAIACLCVSLVLLGVLVACGGSSSTPPPPVSVSVSPGATVYPSYASWPAGTPQTTQFTATVTNSSNTAVTWSVTPANGGSISSTGLYTSPMIALGLPGSATVTATSQADPTKSASTTETITPTTVPTAVVGSPYSLTVTATESTTTHNTSAIALTVE
jgi:Pro-kumamolisin, activation domain/Bacterial Ig-like domain (group 3)